MPKNNVYGGFSQALFFSGGVSIPRFLIDHYSELGMSDREMMLIIHILAETTPTQENIDEQIMIKMGISPHDYKTLLQSLADKGLLTIRKKNSKGYDISGLIDHLFELWGIDQFRQMEAADPGKQKRSAGSDPTLSNLIQVFEQELGRPLTGFECEHIEKWLSAKNSEELIVEALRRGVSAGIRNFRYLDSILREWEKKGIRTRLEVEAEDENFQARQGKKGDKPLKSKAAKNKYDNIYL